MDSQELDTGTVRSVRRALAILRAFGPSEQGVSLGEIARRVGLDKATVRRLLRTLMQETMVVQQPRTREYALGLGVLEIIAGATIAADLRRRALLPLAGLVEQVRLVAYLLVPHAGGALCVEAVEAGPSANSPWALGERRPLHACAATRVLMAYQPDDVRAGLLAGTLPALTTATPTDPQELSGKLDAIRARDWETGLDDAVPGLANAAVPVRNRTGDVIAAIGVTGPHEVMLDGQHPRHLDAMRRTVQEIERPLAG